MYTRALLRELNFFNVTLQKFELGGQQINNKQSIFFKESPSLSSDKKFKKDNPIEQYNQEPPI